MNSRHVEQTQPVMWTILDNSCNALLSNPRRSPLYASWHESQHIVISDFAVLQLASSLQSRLAASCSGCVCDVFLFRAPAADCFLTPFPLIVLTDVLLGNRNSSHSGHKNKSPCVNLTVASLTFFGHSVHGRPWHAGIITEFKLRWLCRTLAGLYSR